MSNILIIKHGSLGDIAQASGAIQDISENHKNDRIYLLTTKAYLEVFKKNPFIHEVILDKRLPRYNLIYLYFLMRELKKHSFSKVFDLQNSSRTNFYKNILFPKAKKETWSSSITTLPEVIDKKEFDKHSVLDRFNHQLQTSGLKTSHTLNPNFSWAGPGPSEINDAKEINAEILLDNGKALDISQLTSLIKESTFVIANDTGPAHIAAHVGARGLTLFGKHTTAYKVSIERDNFKAIEVTDLKNLSAEKVFERLINSLN